MGRQIFDKIKRVLCMFTLVFFVMSLTAASVSADSGNAKNWNEQKTKWDKEKTTWEKEKKKWGEEKNKWDKKKKSGNDYNNWFKKYQAWMAKYNVWMVKHKQFERNYNNWQNVNRQ